MDSKDRIIAELHELNAKLTAQIEQLTARIAALELALAKAKMPTAATTAYCGARRKPRAGRTRRFFVP